MISEFIYHELTTTRKLTSSGDKFSIWKSKIEFVLTDIGVAYVIDNPKPKQPTQQSPPSDLEEYKKWVMDDFTCRHAILSTLEDNLIIVFDYGYDTAKEILDGLGRLYGGKSIGKSMQMYEQFKNFKIAESDNVMECVMKMVGMGIELERYGMNLPEEMRVVYMLDSLPESWNEAKDLFVKGDDDEEEGMNHDQMKIQSFLRFVKNQIEMKAYYNRKKTGGGGGGRGRGGELVEGEASTSSANKKKKPSSRRKNNAGKGVELLD